METDEDATPPPSHPPPQPAAGQKRHSLRPSGTALSLNMLQRDIKEAFSRRCSSLRRRPAPQPTPDGRDVSILVTEPSPEGGAPPRPPLLRQQSEATVVHVLVHRESEEYREGQPEDGPS